MNLIRRTREEQTAYAETTKGQVWRLENFERRFPGDPPARIGTPPYVSNIRPNKYDHRPAGKR